MPQNSNNWQISVFKWNFRRKPPTSIHSSTHSPARFVQLKCCHDRTCHNLCSFHTSYTALIPPWAEGCRLAENPAPRNCLRKDKAPALVGWAGCCHTKKKNQYCWWKASTSCSALPRQWLVLSFSFPVAEQASKGSSDSQQLWSRVKHLGGGNLGYQTGAASP